MKPVQMISINDIKPYEKNPRKITDKAVDVVANSIQRFGFKNPILVDKDMVIIAGHTRRQASLKLGLKEVPVIVCDDLSEEQANALRLADNKTGEFSEWDLDLLDKELLDLEGLNFNMTDFGFESFTNADDLTNNVEGGGGIDDLYTKKVDIPIYETKGEDVSISQLCDTDKTELLINEIKSKKLDKEVEQFLIYSAYRHIVFDYSKIAEFYAGASKEVQELMEKSALVLIDYDKAIENGFVRLSKDLDGIMETEEDDE